MADITFGRRLKMIRERRGISQTDLGNEIGINPNRISNYEIDFRKPPIDVIPILCKGLHCTADELLGMSEIALTDDELYCLLHYRLLDDAGRHTVRAVIDSQLLRMGVE